MQREEQGAVIDFLGSKGAKHADIHRSMKRQCGTSVLLQPLCSTRNLKVCSSLRRPDIADTMDIKTRVERMIRFNPRTITYPEEQYQQ